MKIDELQAQLKGWQDHDPADTRISITPGLAGWLLANQVSLAFTSYQTGQLILAGVGPDGRVAFNEQNYARATGLWAADGTLHVASMFQVWRLENMLRPGQYANNAYDCVLVPREARTVNYVDLHEMAVDRDGRLIFVNSRFSCLATLDEKMSFRPLWRPPFISALAPEDRCHLNGLAMVDGAPAYATAFAVADTKDGWRDLPRDRGVVMEVPSGRIVTDRLALPHSPRVHDGRLWALDSGRGLIVTIDPVSGATEEVAFCPGFLRGLAFHNGHAIVTVSKARESALGKLPLGETLAARGMTDRCGVMIVELASGRIVEAIEYDGKISEMFDVALLPGVRNPMSIGPLTVEMIGAVSIGDAPAPSAA